MPEGPRANNYGGDGALTEKHTPGRCFTHQVKRCEGACLGVESAASHAERLESALAGLKMEAWPYDGPVAIEEGGVFHVVGNWCHYGSVKRLEEAAASMGEARPVFDVDTYKILVRMMKACAVHPIRASLPAESAAVVSEAAAEGRCEATGGL